VRLGGGGFRRVIGRERLEGAKRPLDFKPEECVVHFCLTVKSPLEESPHPVLRPLHAIALSYFAKIDNYKAIFANSMN
jgi:hypothetical protein